MSTTKYGIEHLHGPDGRPRFRWFTLAGRAGEPRMTAVEAHQDALVLGYEHGGLPADRLLGADLWASYTYACGVFGRRPDCLVGVVRMREAIRDAAIASLRLRRAA